MTGAGRRGVRAAVLAAASLAGTGLAVRPVARHVDLVAGIPDAGYRDGPFQRAQFRHPVGLAMSADNQRLYVADQGNDRIRVIHRSEKCRVGTLAGSGERGHRDGPAGTAAFSQPTLLALAGERRLVVWDAGTGFFRSVDLATGTVSTLAAREAGRPAGQPWPGVFGLVYHPGSQALYFTRPDAGALYRLDPVSGAVLPLVQGKPELPRPGALGLYGRQLVVADRASGGVHQVSPYGALSKIGPSGRILSLAASGDVLYAAQTSPESPLLRVLPAGKVELLSAWALPPLANAPREWLPYFAFGDGSVGLAVDPRDDRRLFVASSSKNSVVSVRDLPAAALHPERKSRAMIDLEYPDRKPPATHRILFLGDSRAFSSINLGKEKEDTSLNRMESIPKRLELILDTQAALEDRPLDYQVITMGHVSWEPLIVWPYYEAPAAAQRLGADLVLLMVGTRMAFESYFERPLTGEGIPAASVDHEYLLRRAEDKIPRAGPARTLWEKASPKKLIKRQTETQLSYADFERLAGDPDLRPSLLALVGRPLALLKQKLAGRRPAPRLALLYCPGPEITPEEAYRAFWQETAKLNRIEFVDLSDALNALRLTFLPFGESGGYGHFTPGGNELVASLLARELIRTRMIPW